MNTQKHSHLKIKLCVSGADKIIFDSDPKALVEKVIELVKKDKAA